MLSVRNCVFQNSGLKVFSVKAPFVVSDFPITVIYFIKNFEFCSGSETGDRKGNIAQTLTSRISKINVKL